MPEAPRVQILIEAENVSVTLTCIYISFAPFLSPHIVTMYILFTLELCFLQEAAVNVLNSVLSLIRFLKWRLDLCMLTDCQLSFVLFVWCFSSYSKIFHSYGDVVITGEGLQIFTFARHSWPLSSEVSLACHNYRDTGHPFIMVISETPRFLSLQQLCNCKYYYHCPFTRSRTVFSHHFLFLKASTS